MNVRSGSEPVSGIDPRRLLVFAAIGRSGSLSGAARSLGWTQPAVSQHLQRLEREVRQPLVYRSSRGITLTLAGAALMRHAEAVTEQLRLAADELAALADLSAGRVRMAAFPSASATLVPLALSRLQRQHPSFDVRLTEVEPPDARSLVRTGDIDLAITFTYESAPPETTDDLQVVQLGADPVQAVLPTGHRLADREVVELGELAEERWVAGCQRCRDHLVLMAERAGFVPDVRHSTDDYVVTQTLVAAGFGVSLLPGLALAASRHPGVVALPLEQPLGRTLEVTHLRHHAPVPTVEAMVAVLQATASRPLAG